MQKDLIHIPALLALLPTDRLKPAQQKLLQLCKLEQGMNRVRKVITDPQTDMKIRQMAASLANRMLIEHSKHYSFGYGEKFLLAIVTDLTLPSSIKNIMEAAFLHHARQSTVFVERLLGISEDLLVSIQSVAQGDKQLQRREEEEGIGSLTMEFDRFLSFGISRGEELVEACETVIAIGSVILQLALRDGEQNHEQFQEDDQKSQQEIAIRENHTKTMLKFVNISQKLIKSIFDEYNLQNHPQIFIKIFKIYQELFNKDAETAITHRSIMDLSNCQVLWQTLWASFRFDLQKNRTLSFIAKNQLIFDLRYEASLFLVKLVKYLLQAQACDSVKQTLSFFILPIRDTVVPYDASNPDQFLHNLISLLHYYHISCGEQLNLNEMVLDFEKIVAPIITRILAADRFEYFGSNPDQLYTKLSEIVELKYDEDDVLVVLTKTLKHFTADADFFLYLFQVIRYSLENRLKCGQFQHETSQSLQYSGQPLQLITVFYLLTVIPYRNTLSQPIFAYFKQIFTPEFVSQLDYMELALFYFFLEEVWLQIYEDNPEQGSFLLNHIFTQETNHSSKYFMYQFVYRLSDYYIDDKFIISYVKNLPILHNFPNKWDNVLNWVGYLPDLNEKFTLQFVTIIKGHIKRQVFRYNQEKKEQVDYRQLQKYLQIFLQIAKNRKFLANKQDLQVLLLQQYTNMKDIDDFKIESLLHCLLAFLLPFFKIHEQFFYSILHVLISKHSKKITLLSNNFYLLLAEYIYYPKDIGVLQFIYDHLEQCLDLISMALQLDEIQRESFLSNIANVLILLQNIIVLHIKALTSEIIRKISQKVLIVEEFVIKQINSDSFPQKTEPWTIYARCINIELAIFAMLQHQKVVYFKYITQIKWSIHKHYDAMFLLEMLDMLNLISSPQNRSDILFIVFDILSDLRKQLQNKQNDANLKQTNANLFYLTNKMTPVIPTCRSVFQQIRKFMFFYQIPSWNNLNSRAKNIPFDFVSTFKREYEACMKLEASRRREEHTQYVILVDERRKKYGKKRRAVVSEEEGEGSDCDEVKRPTMHETFSKRIKRDLEQVSTNPNQKERQQQNDLL